ncbi:unnamed protein product [Urochloa humidicola]
MSVGFIRSDLGCIVYGRRPPPGRSVGSTGGCSMRGMADESIPPGMPPAVRPFLGTRAPAHLGFWGGSPNGERRFRRGQCAARRQCPVWLNSAAGRAPEGAAACGRWMGDLGSRLTRNSWLGRPLLFGGSVASIRIQVSARF